MIVYFSFFQFLTLYHFQSRAPRTTQGQYIIYLDFLDSHHEFKENLLTKKHNEQIQADEWDQLVQQLNCISGAPSLPKEAWQSRFKYWRYDLLDKQRKIVLEANATGGGKSNAKPLRDYEKRALSTFNPVTTTGNPKLTLEAGIEQEFVIPVELFAVEDVTAEEEVGYSNESFNNVEYLDEPDNLGVENIQQPSLVTFGGNNVAMNPPAPLLKRKSSVENSSTKKRQRLSQTEQFLNKIEEIELKKAQAKEDRENRATERQEASTAAIVQALKGFTQSISSLATAVAMNNRNT